MPDLNKDIDAGGDPLGGGSIRQFEDLVSFVRKLSFDLHSLKGDIAANTQFTKEVADRQIHSNLAQTALAKTQERTNELLEKIDVDKIAELVGVADNIKGGAKVVSWIGRAFKWAAGIAIAAGGLYTLWNNK